MKKFRAPSGVSIRFKSVMAAASLGLLLGAGVRSGLGQKLPTATAPGASISVGGTYSYFDTKYPQVDLGGVGAYADLNFRRQLGFEAEARWLRQGEVAGSNQTTYLIGPRIETHFGRLSPYAKALVGNGKLTFPYGFGYGNYLVVAGGAGLDVNVTENIKVRVIDFEYQDWPKFTLGEIAPYGVSFGVSYRVYHAGGWAHHRSR